MAFSWGSFGVYGVCICGDASPGGGGEAVNSERKPMFGHTIIVKAKSSYDEMKITYKCPFSEDWLLNFEVSVAEGDFQVEYSSVSCTGQIMGAVTTNYPNERRLL